MKIQPEIENPVSEELLKLRELLWGKAFKLSYEIPYAKRYEKAKLQGEYDAIKSIWDQYEFDNPKWTAHKER